MVYISISFYTSQEYTRYENICRKYLPSWNTYISIFYIYLIILNISWYHTLYFVHNCIQINYSLSAQELIMPENINFTFNELIISSAYERI